ncbi:MAG: Mur ligase family protein [Pseudomonadota bacterium]
MISQFSLTELAKQYGGDCIGSDKTFSSVSIDTRTLAPGELFVAIKGQRFDAHDYLDKAIEKGAKGLVIEVCSRAKLSNEVIAAHELAVWLVEDGVKALGDIARYQRQLFAKPIIAVTGSSGKTTVKGMLRSIFAAFVGEHSTFATRGNFNNHIGVPLSLMQLNKNHQYAVIEMGASGPNEIDYLSSITRPSVALVNNVMPAHVEGFGSIDGIAKAKGEIYEGLGEAGVAVVNADDVYANQWLLQNKHRRIIVFSVADGAKSLPESIDVFLKVSAKNIQERNLVPAVV